MRLFEKLIGIVNQSMMWVCGVILAFMGFLVTLDIIFRSLKMPIQWAFELTAWLSATIALLGGGYSLFRGGHVKIDIIYLRFPGRTRAILDVFTSLFFFLLCAVLVWMGSVIAYESYQSKATTGLQLNPPMFIPQLLVPLGGLLIGLQGLVLFIRNLKIALTGKAEKGDE